jgi:hypothetical protein
VEAGFSEAMDPATINDATFTLTRQGSTTPVTAAVSYDAATNKAVLNPAQDLEGATPYTASVKGGVGGVKDLAGNPLDADKRWTFSTLDTSPPPPEVALSFDGVDDRVSVPSSSLLNTASTTARTYEALIKTGTDVSRRQFVYEEGGSGNGLSVEISGGRVHFSAWSTTNSWGTVSASAPVSPNTSYHVAGVYDRAGGDLRVYLDGALQGTSSGAVGVMPSHGDGVAIGGISGSTRDRANAVLTSGNHFGGRVGEFAAWNQARTAAQVQADAQSDLQGNEAGLIVLYKVQEGSGTVLNDSTVNGLHGTINGASWTTQ